MGEVRVDIKPKRFRTEENVGYRQRRPDVIYVDIIDDEDDGLVHRWDLSFMLSHYSCGFGHTCQGIGGHADTGCCDHGSDLDYYDKKGKIEIERIDKYVERLTPEQWQHYDVGREKGWHKKIDGTKNTRLVDGACIFANREGFSGGAGCALHIGAVEAGENYRDWKPMPCNTWPLWVVDLEDEFDDESLTYKVIRPIANYEWNPDSHYWCIADREMSRSGSRQVWRALKEDLILMVGESAYNKFVRWLDKHHELVASLSQADVEPTQWDMRTLTD